MGKYMLALFKEQVLSRKKEQGGEKIKNIALDESPLKLRPWSKEGECEQFVKYMIYLLT